jgi:hypothetical protein
MEYKAVDEGVEGVGGCYVLELLACGVLGEASGITHYLGDLTACGVGVGPEIGEIARTAWLAGATAWISADEPSGSQPTYVLEECRANRHVLKHLHNLIVVEACGIGHYLG